MDYLARSDSSLSGELWNQIDAAVIEAARRHIVCRRFLPVYGPLGAGTFHVPVDAPAKAETAEEGIMRVSGRKMAELLELFEDFTLLWRDMAEAEKNGYPPDLSPAIAAAQRAARQEDNLILFGDKKSGAEGLFTAKDAHKIKRGDWSSGEEAYKDAASAVAYFAGANMRGRLALVASPDVCLQLQRLQPSTGILEVDRIKKLIGGKIYSAGDFGQGKAALVCAEPQYMDIALGMDLSVGYLGQSELNHPFRIMETVALRIKQPKAIALFE